MRFHVEHRKINNIFKNHEVDITAEQAKLLTSYSNEIYNYNKKFNLTGLKTRGEIIEVLLLQSIKPISKKDVPRGTSFLDIGTGAGIPGVPLSVYFNNLNGVLVDSNQKKINFLDRVLREFEISNLKTLCCRVEELAKDHEYRESFQLVFSRGVGEPFIAMELGAAFVSVEGLMVIYSNKEYGKVGSRLGDVSLKYGLEVLDEKEKINNGISGNVIVLKKNRPTDLKYPRRYTVIKRESVAFSKLSN